jgi:hypothetical protein
MVSETMAMVLAEGQHTMALDQSALLEVLEALKAAEVDDRIRRAAETIEDVPAFVELESGGPPPVACQVVGAGQLPSHPTKEGDRREQHLSEGPPPCPA